MAATTWASGSESGPADGWHSAHRSSAPVAASPMGPGADEDAQGEPFVGRAGKKLDQMIKSIGFERKDVYIANVVKCRPPGNRDPQPDEVAACRGWLHDQIETVRPRVIVMLGRVAAQTLLGSDESLGRMRGRWHRVLGIDARATYHPAALLRSASWKRPTWEDMQEVRDRLREGAGDGVSGLD